MRLSRCFRGSGVAVAFLLALSAGCGNAAPTGVLTGSFRIEEGGPAGLHTLPIFGHIVIFQGFRREVYLRARSNTSFLGSGSSGHLSGQLHVREDTESSDARVCLQDNLSDGQSNSRTGHSMPLVPRHRLTAMSGRNCLPPATDRRLGGDMERSIAHSFKRRSCLWSCPARRASPRCHRRTRPSR